MEMETTLFTRTDLLPAPDLPWDVPPVVPSHPLLVFLLSLLPGTVVDVQQVTSVTLPRPVACNPSAGHTRTSTRTTTTNEPIRMLPALEITGDKRRRRDSFRQSPKCSRAMATSPRADQVEIRQDRSTSTIKVDGRLEPIPISVAPTRCMAVDEVGTNQVMMRMVETWLPCPTTATRHSRLIL